MLSKFRAFVVNYSKPFITKTRRYEDTKENYSELTKEK